MTTTHGRPAAEPPDLRERGAQKGGAPQHADRRLFVQFTAFTGCRDAAALAAALPASGLEGALYEDVHDLRGIGLATLSEDPALFVTKLRPWLSSGPFGALQQKTEYSLLGRTYSLGHEPNLEDWLLERPRRTMLDPRWPWAIWYPLRRTGAFSALAPEEQKLILREHGAIGHAFGEAGYAHDIRLACHGLDSRDNDFVIGLVGPELHPLSALVETMRKTRQTAQFIQSMGPFFVGRVLWQSPSPK